MYFENYLNKDFW